MTVQKGEKYQHQAWPAVRYGPNGQADIFQSADEVPEGWVDHPSKIGKKTSDIIRDEHGEGEGEGEELKLTAQDIAEAFSQDELIAKIDEINEERGEDDQIEYAGNWAKVKLAQALIDAGIELEIEED